MHVRLGDVYVSGDPEFLVSGIPLAVPMVLSMRKNVRAAPCVIVVGVEEDGMVEAVILPTGSLMSDNTYVEKFTMDQFRHCLMSAMPVFRLVRNGGTVYVDFVLERLSSKITGRLKAGGLGR